MTKKIWVITGEYAYPMVKKYITEYVIPLLEDTEVKVLKIPVRVIGLTTSDTILYYLRGLVDKDKPDIIMVPGLVRGDLKKVMEELGVRVIRGPRRLEHLLLAFMVGVDNLDPVRPAEDIISEKLGGIIKEAWNERLRKSINIGDLKIPLNPPPFILALILDHGLGNNWLKNYILTYTPDILAFPPREPVEEVLSLVKELRRQYDGRIAAPYQYLDAIVNEGIRVSLVYSVLPEQVDSIEKKYGVVVESYSDPASALRTVKSEPDRIILDASLPPDPFSLPERLKYLEEAKGVAKSAWPTNIAWGIDADSHGIYGLLLPLLAKAGAGLLFIWELEEKLYWSLQEIRALNTLFLLSAHLKQCPRDLGVDMLIVKPKMLHRIVFENPRRIIEATSSERITMDPMGIFKIRVNHREELIEVLYIGRKGRILIRGKTAREIRDTIIREGLLSRLDHALYIGGELAKAEEALRLGLDYIQDSALLPSRKEKRGLICRTAS